MTITHAQLVNLTKLQYKNGLEEALGERCKILARLPKGKLEGTGAVHKVKHSTGNKGGSTFATIQSNHNASSVDEFRVLDHMYNYATFSLENAAIHRNASAPAAAKSYVKSELDSALDDLAIQTGVALYGDGSGLLGVIGSVAGTRLTLETREDIVNYQIGHIIDNGTTTGSDAVLAGQATQIVGIDEDAGVLIAENNWHASYNNPGRGLFRQGSFANQIWGLERWNPPATVDLTVSFANVVRSVNPTKLAGRRYTTSAQDGTYLRAIGRALAQITRGVKNSPKEFELFVNNYVMERILEEASGRIELVTMPGRAFGGGGGDASFGLRAVRVTVGDSSCVIHSDIQCPKNIARLLQTDAVEVLPVPGGFPHILEGGDGMTMPTQDAKEWRFACYWNMRILRPWEVMRVDFTYLNDLYA